MINVLTLEPGMRVWLVDGAVSNPRNSIWILLQYLTVPDPSEQSHGEELVFAENIERILRTTPTQLTRQTAKSHVTSAIIRRDEERLH